MRLLYSLIFSLFSNFVALILAGNFIAGFQISDNLINVAIAAALFTILNSWIRPIIKMILSPLVFLTLGLFTLVINAGMLYLLDILSDNVTIGLTQSLIYGTLLIAGVNFLLHFSAKRISH